jgi:hypothetical protein
MRLFAFTFLTLSMLSACGTTSQRQSSICEVAAAFTEMVVTDMSERQIVFSDEPVALQQYLDPAMSTADDRLTASARPPAALLNRFRQLGPTNAVSSCAPVQTLLRARQIRFGRQAEQQGLRQNSNGVFASSIVSVSAPVVSTDGQQALIGSSIASGTLDGFGYLSLLQRQPNGRWQVIAEYRLFVS